MDLETITTVISVARLKSFNATALSIPCSQSSVSRRVEAAENELGVKIFNRPKFGGAKTLTLTPIGEEVVRSMVRIVDAYENLYRVVGETQGMEERTLSVGIMSNSMPPSGMSKMKSDFYDICPNTTLSVKCDKLTELFNLFRTRSLDAVLFPCREVVPDALDLGEGETLEYLGSMPRSFGISSSDPLVNDPNAAFSGLEGHTIFLNKTSDIHLPGIVTLNPARIIGSCRNAGFEPNIQIIPTGMLEIRYEKAKAGQGVFPSHAPNAWRSVDGISYVFTTDSEDINARYYLLRAKDRNEDLLDIFAEFFSNHLE